MKLGVEPVDKCDTHIYYYTRKYEWKGVCRYKRWGICIYVVVLGSYNSYQLLGTPCWLHYD